MNHRITHVITPMTVLVAVLALLGALTPADAHERTPAPVTSRAFADPSVLSIGAELLAISTGSRAPGAISSSPLGRWKSTGPLLHHLPGWAAGGAIWAADAAHVGHGKHGHWVMYYSAPVRGLASGARCIGVAVSHDPSKGFNARGRKPLVCPAGAQARRADDQLVGRTRRQPHSGVIDPSFFKRGKRMYLLYRTQRTPASIRIVQLYHGGRRASRHSHQILQVPHIVENPVLVHRGHRYVLFTSEGYFGSCGYRTTWRSSRSILHFPTAGHELLTDRRTRVCGPGGLDVTNKRLVFFHGWVCGAGRKCEFGHHVDTRGDSRRTLYAGRLTWRHGRPHVRTLRAAHVSAKKHPERHATRSAKKRRKKHHKHHHKKQSKKPSKKHAKRS